MKYVGKLYAKIGGRYIECTQTIEDVITEAHMAGQTYAGSKHPSFGDAVGYLKEQTQ